MTDQEAETQIRRLRTLGEKWIKPIGLTSWFIVHVNYDRGSLPVNKDGRGTTATVWVDHRYHEAEITFYLPQCAKLDDQKLERAFVHELSHLLLSRLQFALPHSRGSEERIEETATQLASTLLWTRLAGQDEGQLRGKKKRKV
jgi:hypothetical protein